jgi:hypothetical protein
MDGSTSSVVRDATITGAITGVAGTLLGVLIGFSLQRIDRRWEEVEGARVAKALLLATPRKNWLYPKLFPHLRQLRLFFIKHPVYLKKNENNFFYLKWLTNPVLETELDTTTWKDEVIEDMLKDLSETKIWLLNRHLF